MLKKQLLEFIKARPGQFLAFNDLARELGVGRDGRQALRRALEELVSLDMILRVKRDKYVMPSRAELMTGRLSCHRDGYGFVIPDSKGEKSKDIFIGPRDMGEAWHGDRVLVRVERRPKGEGEKLAGRVMKVLERASTMIVGKYYAASSGGYVVPLDERHLHEVKIINHLPLEQRGAAVRKLSSGMIVDVEILSHPGGRERPRGRVVEVLGYPGDPDIEYRIAMRKRRIPYEFSAEAAREAAALPTEVRNEELSGRRDFRRLLTVTIDGESARDFDDAVGLEKLPNGNYLLYVHIADVSHYVREGSALDREARARATSVYFPDRAVPMLPPELSSGIASLKPKVDRLAFSVAMEIDGKGTVIDKSFVPSVIRSDERLTYTSVARALEGDAREADRYAELMPMLKLMRELCLILNARRRARGAIDFDLPEPVVRFDSEGKVVDIVRSERNIAHRIIEEFMLAANEAVASFLYQQGAPALFRVHEEPDPRKVAEFQLLAARFGYKFGKRNGRFDSRDFQQLSERLAGKPEAQVLSYLMLRSFMQARYSETNSGHFGLASESYTHFTSPIRRYPDLLVHRVLKKLLCDGAEGAGPDRRARLEQELTKLAEAARHCSERERAAAEAEREIVDWMRAELMARRLGEEYEGLITGVTGYGFYVELLEPFVEGFVPIDTLDDYYRFDPEARSLIGRRRRYRLGQRLRVRVDSVDRERRRILLSVV